MMQIWISIVILDYLYIVSSSYLCFFRIIIIVHFTFMLVLPVNGHVHSHVIIVIVYVFFYILLLCKYLTWCYFTFNCHFANVSFVEIHRKQRKKEKIRTSDNLFSIVFLVRITHYSCLRHSYLDVNCLIFGVCM